MHKNGQFGVATQAVRLQLKSIYRKLGGGDPFDYLTQLQRHAADLAARHEASMP